MWITCTPLAWLLIVTYTAGWQKIFDASPRIGFLAQADVMASALAAGKIAASRVAETQILIFNARLDAVVCGVFLVLVTIVVLDSLRVWAGILSGTRETTVRESPFVLTQLRPEEI